VSSTSGWRALPSFRNAPHTTTSQRKLSHVNGADLVLFLVEFTNRGKASCSMSGVPHAQAVDGPKRTAVGAAAKYVSLSGAPRRGLVVLHAHGGKAYVEYYVVNETDWTTKLCRPDTARGVILSPVSNWGFYIPISRLAQNGSLHEASQHLSRRHFVTVLLSRTGSPFGPKTSLQRAWGVCG